MWGVRHGHHMGAPVRFARHAVRIPIYLLWSWGPVHQLWVTIPARYQCIRCRQHHNEGSCDLFLYPSDHFYSRTVVCVPSSMVELYRMRNSYGAAFKTSQACGIRSKTQPRE